MNQVDALLNNLNQSQRAAVSSFADTLAILAGPGSGKTHTLTSRTAWLLVQGLQPWNIIVATFTVKAAREMKERIGKLIGNGMESKLILGTFHSISRRYLARYGHLINIKKDFGIADSADSLAILKRICKRNDFIIDPKVARSRISGRKAKGGDVEAGKQSTAKSIESQEMELCYTQYEEALQRSNLLDYDDLLLRCVELLREHPSCVSNVEAVLIDEFQDTNLVQFDLMRLLAAQRKRITIVGDPDQSIYGFRAAEIKNYKRMLHQYPDTVTIALEENYRSSGAILQTALSVIEQDSSRVAKSLLPTHTIGTRPVLRKLASAHREAEWLITEIQRVIGLTGGLLDLNDFAILLRSASLSRLIESALGKAGIAYRMVGGLRFYDRIEVKTILDYLRVVNQPDNNDALSRIINTPSRRIGEATIKALLEEADAAKITLWTLMLGVVQGKRTSKSKLGKQCDQGLSKFVNVILTARNKMTGLVEERMSIVNLIKFIVKKTDYEIWLEEHHGDVSKARWANVEELMTQATDFQDLSRGYDDEALPEIDGVQQENDADSHLTKFLANVALASEVQAQDSDGMNTAQVTISTIHAAKGLEWPVVFIPAAYQGSIPHSRAEDSNEERRLLYVAMTRAKALLYLSSPLKNSQSEQTTLSPFLTPKDLTLLLAERGPPLQSSAINDISQILRRALPTPAAILKSSAKLPSYLDDLFIVDGEDEHGEVERRWDGSASGLSFTMGQQAPKRRRIELKRSTSNVEEKSEIKWRAGYTTTMDRVSSFTPVGVSSTSGFTTASSHMEVLKEQSMKCVELPEAKETASKKSSKQKLKVLEGQGTLMCFLGKTNPSAPTSAVQHPTARNRAGSRHPIIQGPKEGSTLQKPRESRADGEPRGILPALATHRLGTGATGLLRPQNSIEEDTRNDYVFLSSSPPRRKPPEEDSALEKSIGLTANPPLLPFVRPASTLHMTSISMLQSANCTAARKTLGVKRSMNGWTHRKGQGFVPPTMKRPT